MITYISVITNKHVFASGMLFSETSSHIYHIRKTNDIDGYSIINISKLFISSKIKSILANVVCEKGLNRHHSYRKGWK